MLCREVILLSALCLVLGKLPSSFSQQYEDEDNLEPYDTLNTPSPPPTSSSLPDMDDPDVDEVMGACLFGFPTCMIKCFWKSKSTYCDEEANCLCRSENIEDDVVEGLHRASNEDFTTLQPDIDTEEGVMGECFFHSPSPLCWFRCSVRGQSSVCDEESRCLCENRNLTEVLTPSNSQESVPDLEPAKNESESENNGSVVFFILDLGGLFETEEIPSKDDPKNIYIAHELWTVPHIVTMAVLILVAVLLVLEITLCCKRRYRHPCKQQLQTVLSSEGLEKGVMNEKPQ